jgi:glycosyltransferase involved in cell wall biosynthesis
LHGRQDLPDVPPLYTGFDDMPLVSISDDQRRPVPKANFVATIYHGLPSDLFTCNLSPRGNYLAFLGRIAPEKRPDRAIAIAREAGVHLKIAAKVDPADEEYFHNVIEPMLREPGVEFVGEISDGEKSTFLGEAGALLFPIDWPEPFGLVMIESMACGTPVLAFNRGSAPEIIEPGLTGMLVESTESAIEALPRVLSLDRGAIRRRFEERFSAARMAENYDKLYRRLRGPIDSFGEEKITAPALTG